MAAATPGQVRAFIAIALEPGWILVLKQVQRQFQTGLPEDAVRWVRAEQIHLTLKFLGNVSRERLTSLSAGLNQASAGIAPIETILHEQHGVAKARTAGCWSTCHIEIVLQEREK